MAKALQCPACGTKKRVDTLPDGASFRCEQCGQVLKVPPGLGRASAGAAPAPVPAPARQPASSAGPSSGGAAPPAPRRRTSRPTMTAGGAAAGAGGTAVLSSEPPVAAPVAPAPVVAPPRGSSGDTGSERGRDDAGGRSKRDALPLPLRVLAWLVALPLGLAIVGLPARKAGYLSSQKLLDVIVKSDITRFVPILVIILLWALVSALLVTLFVEGGRRWMLRRRRKHAAAATTGPAVSRSDVSVPARKGRA
jgi:hypothetical protein